MTGQRSFSNGPVTACAHDRAAVANRAEIPSVPGFEKVAINTAASVAEWMGFPAERVEDLKTVVAEACGMLSSHGNRFNRALWVGLTVRLGADALEVLVNDRGQGVKGFAVPGIDLKLAGLEPPRGMGIFLTACAHGSGRVHQRAKWRVRPLRTEST